MIARMFFFVICSASLGLRPAVAVEIEVVGNNSIVFGGTSKPGPFRITPQSLVLVEAQGSTQLLAKGQIVDLIGTVAGKEFTAKRIVIHSRAKLTARKKVVSGAGSKIIKGQQKPIPAAVTGQVISTEPLTVQSLGLVFNTYELQTAAGNTASVPLRENFARRVFTVKGGGVRVLLTQAVGLLESGMSVRRHDTSGAFLKSIYAYSRKKISKDEFDRVMGLTPKAKKKKGNKAKS